MKKLIIFDLDGVLLDNKEIHINLNLQFFKRLGVPINLEEPELPLRMSDTRMWDYIKEKFNLSQSVEELIEIETELKHAALKENDLNLAPGVLDFLEFLKHSGYTITGASSGFRKNIDLILSKLNIAHCFDFAISAEQVVREKPKPDILLKVAAHYQQHPMSCIVVENSTNGVLAAKAANMYCVGYRNPSSSNQDLSEADMIMDSFKDQKLFDLVESYYQKEVVWSPR